MCNVCVWRVTENNSGRQGTTNIFLLTLLHYTLKPTLLLQYSLTAQQVTSQQVLEIS